MLTNYHVLTGGRSPDDVRAADASLARPEGARAAPEAGHLAEESDALDQRSALARSAVRRPARGQRTHALTPGRGRGQRQEEEEEEDGGGRLHLSLFFCSAP